jgi:hypothetical protein
MPQHGLRARHLPWSVSPAEPPPGSAAEPPEVTVAPVDEDLDPLEPPDELDFDEPEPDFTSGPLRVGPYVPPYAGRIPRPPRPGSLADARTMPLRYEPDPADAGPDDGRYRGRRRLIQAADRNRSAIVAVLATLAVAASAVFIVAVYPAPRQTGLSPRTGGTSHPPSPAPSASAPGFAPITIEAESAANTLTGSADPTTYPGASGGKVVRFIGNWGSVLGAGALRFNGIVAPATGTYVMTFAYVNINMNEPTRAVLITASGPGSVLSVVAGGSVCCSTQIVKVYLVKGTNAITFSNPQGHAPTIDRITIDWRQ